MSKLIWSVVAVVGLIGISHIAGDDANTTQNDRTVDSSLIKTISEDIGVKKDKIETPQCDGTMVTADCFSDGQKYTTFVHHPAVAEVSHVVTRTVYENKVVSYCTRCMDGTFSPSCATGRGACSHHGGVAQWNAPRYGSVPVTVKETVVDVPAAKEYFEKVIAE